MSTVADGARTPLRMTRGGAGFRRRLRHARTGSSAAIVAASLVAALLGGCTPPVGETEPDGTTTPAPTTEEALDPAAQQACATFWGDPDYRAPLSRDVLDRAATATENGASDPMFYAITGDDVDAAFADAPEDLRRAADPVAEWFRTDAAKGEDADLGVLEEGLTGLAGACSSTSEAAAWFPGDGEDGTKPAALTCADVFDTPGTFTVYANANVLTSNMFKVVGRTPKTVPEDRLEDAAATRELLNREIAAVDDEGVSAALVEVRAPFDDAASGDLSSPGLQEPLEQLGTACGEVGYDAGFGAQDGQDDSPSDDGEGLA